jgi:hypothetical protein
MTIINQEILESTHKLYLTPEFFLYVGRYAQFFSLRKKWSLKKFYLPSSKQTFSLSIFYGYLASNPNKKFIRYLHAPEILVRLFFFEKNPSLIESSLVPSNDSCLSYIH